MRSPAKNGRSPHAALSALMATGFVAVAAALSCYAFIAPGHPSSVDVWPHLARQSIVYHAVKEGFSPFYTFMHYCGFPALRFYSPLFYFLGGPLTLLTGGNLLLALRILLVTLHLVSALAMYLYLVKREGRGEQRMEGMEFGPALGAIAYLVVPWRTLYLAGSANYPQALVYVLMPLAFLALEHALHDGDGGRRTRVPPRQGLLLGLWVGLLFLAHVVYAVFTLLFLAFWWATRRPKRTVSEWRAPATAALAGIGVSAFFLVPFAAEQASHRFPITHLNLGVPNLMVLLGFKSRAGGYAGAYLGLSVVILTLVAIAALVLRRRYRSQVPALFGLAAGLCLSFGPALLGEKQYLITTGLPPERFLLFVIFFIAILVPTAYKLLRNALARWRLPPGVVFAVVAGVVISDCLQAMRVYFVDRSKLLAVREEIYPIIRSEPRARLLDLNIPEPRVDDVRRTCRLPTVGVIYGGLPSPLGLPYHQYAPRSMLHVYPWVSYIAGDLGATDGQPISGNTHKALALMGASHLITLPTIVSTSGSDSGPFGLLLKEEMDWDDRFVAAGREPPLAFGRTNQGLVLAANKVVPMAPDTLVADHSFIVARNWRRLLDTLQLDQGNHRLNFIPALSGTAPESLPGRAALTIDSARIRHQDVVTGFRVSADCFLRLAVSYYPELRIRLDGKPVQFFEAADHFTYIRCPAGSHVLRVTARLGGLRLATLALSLISIPAVLVLVLRRGRSKPVYVARR